MTFSQRHLSTLPSSAAMLAKNRLLCGVCTGKNMLTINNLTNDKVTSTHNDLTSQHNDLTSQHKDLSR